MTITQRRIGVRDEYAPKFGRQTLTLWSGAFSSGYEGSAIELPGHNGYMVSVYRGLGETQRVRVECPSPRTDQNYEQVDDAIQAAYDSMDGYGRTWPNVPLNERCNGCGQPDNTGDCDHVKLADDEVKQLGGVLEP